jgi:hypothetical protein
MLRLIVGCIVDCPKDNSGEVVWGQRLPASAEAQLGSPPQLRRGGREVKKENSAATFDGADGVVLVKRMHDFLTNTTPSRGMKVAARFLFDIAQPPLLS